MQLNFLKGDGGLLPFDDRASSAIAKWKMGDLIQVEAKRPRNYQFHKLFFELLNYVFDCQDKYTNYDHFREAFLIAVGHCECIILADGTTNYKAKSISFANCDETEFAKVYNDSINAALEHFLPGHTQDDFDKQQIFIMEFS